MTGALISNSTCVVSVGRIRESDLHGSMSMATGGTAVLEGLGMARAESMEITNDPRFFTDNVINYRLLGSLAPCLRIPILSDFVKQRANMENTF